VLAALLFAWVPVEAASKYKPLDLYEMIGLADLLAAGTITELNDDELVLRLEHVGFGEVAGDSIRIERFVDWTCARRYAPYEVGQRCVYFLARGSSDAYRILSDGGEGEMPIEADDQVTLSRPFIGKTLALAELLEESRRFRAHVRFGRLPGASGLYHIEPAVSREEFATYRRSSPAARFLCQSVDAAALLDPAAASFPVGRERLGLNGAPSFLRVLADREGDGVAELLAGGARELRKYGLEQDGSLQPSERLGELADVEALASLAPDSTGRPRLAVGAHGELGVFTAAGKRVLERGPGLRSADALFGTEAGRWRLGHALANLGDLDGDGTIELALGAREESGPARALWLVSLASDGAARQVRLLFRDPDPPAYAFTLEPLGDLDGNGVGDLAVGLRERHHGRTAHVFFLGRAGELLRDVRVASGPDNSHLARQLAGVGDWDGDGIVDLALTTSASTVQVLLLARDGNARASIALELPFDLDWKLPVLAAWPDDEHPRLLFGATAALPGTDRQAGAVWIFEPERGEVAGRDEGPR
jgi:hypothetical protein